VTGVNVRLSRILKNGRSVVCPLDYGGFMGPVEGIRDPAAIVDAVVAGGADALLVNPGFARSEWTRYAGKAGLIVRVTGGSTKFNPNQTYHTLVCDVKEACALGADAVCIMVFAGSEQEQEMFYIMSQVTYDAHSLGIPVLAEVLPADPDHRFDSEWIAVCARVGYELGADMVKTYFSTDGFDSVVQACPIPIVIAGGPKTSDARDVARQAIACGAAGVAFGRNVFQSGDPEAEVRALRAIVHGS